MNAKQKSIRRGSTRKNPVRGSRSDTHTSSDVRSPTRTATSTHARTTGNVTVTGGAGAGATTRVTIRKNPIKGKFQLAIPREYTGNFGIDVVTEVPWLVFTGKKPADYVVYRDLPKNLIASPAFQAEMGGKTQRTYSMSFNALVRHFRVMIS